MDKAVKEKFSAYPDHVRPKMEFLREIILDVAANTGGVGQLEETLKWGEPSYLTTKTKSGTTIRIDWKAKSPEQYAMYVNCKTTLVDSYRSLFPNTFTYEGDRAVIFGLDEKLAEDELRLCIQMALRYHLDKNT